MPDFNFAELTVICCRLLIPILLYKCACLGHFERSEAESRNLSFNRFLHFGPLRSPPVEMTKAQILITIGMIYNIPYLGVKQEESLSACLILMALDSQQPFGSRADNRVENSFPAGIVNQSALVAIFQQHGFCLFTQNIPNDVYPLPFE